MAVRSGVVKSAEVVIQPVLRTPPPSTGFFFGDPVAQISTSLNFRINALLPSCLSNAPLLLHRVPLLRPPLLLPHLQMRREKAMVATPGGGRRLEVMFALSSSLRTPPPPQLRDTINLFVALTVISVVGGRLTPGLPLAPPSPSSASSEMAIRFRSCILLLSPFLYRLSSRFLQSQFRLR